ncbi:MAG TPA: phosphatase PAP2 family protein [Candidatus Binatia bacterium]|nr:phosphatase PAP2 family protein [Candidatus Binatia bacterium]
MLEARTLIALFVSVGALLVFAEFVDRVVEGDTRAFDESVLLAFRDPNNPSHSIGPAWLQIMFRDITPLGGYAVVLLISLAVIGYLLMDGKRGAALWVLVSVSGGAVISNLLKLAIERPRPDLVARLVEVNTSSFPSGHATLAAVTYLTLGALLSRVEARRRAKVYVLTVAVVLTVLIGVSRIYLGVHWPTDVLAGWCVGAAWAMLCWRIALALQRSGKVESDV